MLRNVILINIVLTVNIATSSLEGAPDPVQDDPINVLPNVEEVLEEQGEQFNPEFSDSLVEKLNPSSTVEVQDKSEEIIGDGGINSTAEELIADSNSTTLQNATEKNGTETKQLRCVLKILPEGEEAKVHIMNTSVLAKALQPIPNITSGECALVMFYSPWCPFSVKAAPHFNALPRLFPHFSFYALDVISHTSMNMRYGLVAIPTLLLFHNGKAIVKFNESEPTLEKLVIFIEKYTGIKAQGNMSLLPEDQIGPISSIQALRTDYLLIISWLFTIICFCWWFSKSTLCHRIVESVRNTWREAEAQHDHTE